MAARRIPTYYGFRIYFTSSVLYFFLSIPFLLYLGFQNIPERAKAKGWLAGGTLVVNDSVQIQVDSLTRMASRADSLGRALGEAVIQDPELIDSLVEQAVARGQAREDSLSEHKGPRIVVETESDDNDHQGLFEKGGPFIRYSQLMFFITLLSYLIGLIFNLPFKRFFKKTARKREIPDRTRAYCRKYLLGTPLINALIIILPNLVAISFSLIFLLSHDSQQAGIERNLFLRFFYLTVVATALEFLFAYYWQKHRTHIKYIDFLYTPEELRVQVFRRKGGKIRYRYLIASVITTFLPFMIVVVYLLLSITFVRDLDFESLSYAQRQILLGPYGDLFKLGTELLPIDKFDWLFYVNAGDSLLMIIGISNSILVSLIYVLLFIRWTTQYITLPLSELLTHMRNTRGGSTEQFTIVRTNDEIGELAEGYNEMTRKIHEHVEHISRMNRDLEKTVEDRTREVVMQKEEIEAQKEEIEAQLDLATLQRDTISSQKEQILDSIRYAERIQSAILPPAENLASTLSEHFILFLPRDIVSGDYYWTSVRDGKLLVAVADCTGHGVPGAFLSVLGISAMNEIVNREGAIHASQVLEKLRDFVVNSLHQMGTLGEAQDGIEIALCIIDPRRKIMEFAGANRPVYLVRSRSGKRGSGPGELIHVKGDRMPIGIYEHESTPFTNHEIRLQKGDAVYLFSDGYVDQMGGPRRKTFRSVHFRELLLEIQDRNMEEQKQILQDRYLAWRGEVEQIDDILVLGFRL